MDTIRGPPEVAHVSRCTSITNIKQGLRLHAAAEGEGGLVPGGGAQGRQQRAAAQGGQRRHQTFCKLICSQITDIERMFLGWQEDGREGVCCVTENIEEEEEEEESV